MPTGAVAFFDTGGVGTCGLCDLHYVWLSNECCDGCPIFVKTGQRYCLGTPHERISQVLEDLRQIGDSRSLYEVLEVARAEEEFLVDLWVDVYQTPFDGEKKGLPPKGTPFSNGITVGSE